MRYIYTAYNCPIPLKGGFSVGLWGRPPIWRLCDYIGSHIFGMLMLTSRLNPFIFHSSSNCLQTHSQLSLLERIKEMHTHVNGINCCYIVCLFRLNSLCNICLFGCWRPSVMVHALTLCEFFLAHFLSTVVMTSFFSNSAWHVSLQKTFWHCVHQKTNWCLLVCLWCAKFQHQVFSDRKQYAYVIWI